MVLNYITNKISAFELTRSERIWKMAHIDFKKRYYDSYFGLVWALFNPLFRISVYYFVFTFFINLDSEDNYALYLFSGLIIWMFFIETSKKELLLFSSKKYLLETIQIKVPDLFYSTSISTGLGFAFNLLAYIIIALLYGITFSFSVLYLPVLFVTLFLLSTGVGMILASISIFFKDITYFWDLVSLLGFWTCPIFFRGEAIIEKAPLMMYLNPMTGIIYNARPMLLKASNPDYFLLLYDLVFSAIIFALGHFVVNKASILALERV